MKQFLLLLYITAGCLLLSGCRSDLYSGHRDMEHLRPVQTVGLDANGEAVTLSVSTGAGPEDEPPLVLRAEASGIEAAAARLQDWSPEDELFYAHVRYILLGEGMAGTGVDAVLDWVERSPAMRMDTPLLLVRGRAEDAVIGASGGDADVTARAASLERVIEARGEAIPTLRQTASSLLERGWALCLAAELLPEEGTNFTGPEKGLTLVPAGLALLHREGEDTRVLWLTGDEETGTALLLSSAAGRHVQAGESMLELIRADAEASGLWSGGGELTGVRIVCELRAGVLERGGDAADDTALAEALCAAAEGWLMEAVARARETGCDFLGLGDAVRRNAPRGARPVPDEDAAELPVTVEVRAEITRGYDLAG